MPERAVNASVSASIGFEVALTPLIVGPAIVKEPAGAAVSLIRFRTTAVGFPARAVSVIFSVIGAALKEEAGVGRVPLPLPGLNLRPGLVIVAPGHTVTVGWPAPPASKGWFVFS